MKRIVAYLQGGLGNQCFVYATARALALRSGATLAFDARLFDSDRIYRRKLALEPFNCALSISPRISTLHRKIWNLARLKFPLLLMVGGRYKIELGRKEYCPLPDDWRGTLRLDGYWQSEKYFYDQREAILADLTPRNLDLFEGDTLAREIGKSPRSTFLHIRSYMESPGAEDGSWALPVAYYIRALNYIKEQVGGNLKVFVFSDNIEWAKQKFDALAREYEFVYVEPVGRPEDAQLRDFMLMRKCKHGIVANSSFSWWAGWLGEQARMDKGEKPIRIRPDVRVNNDDFWPRGWIPVGISEV